MLGAELGYPEYLARLRKELDRVDEAQIKNWADLVYGCWVNGRSVYVIGNGGSGTTASHMAEDLGKRYAETRGPAGRVKASA